MTSPDVKPVRWRQAEVTSPRHARPVPVIVARDIPYLPDANRFQNLSVYVPVTPETSALIGTPVASLPGSGSEGVRYHVHIHGGGGGGPPPPPRSVAPAGAHALFPRR